MNSDNPKTNAIYTSLKVRNNLLMALLTGLLCVILVLINQPVPILSIVFACIFGFVAGWLQTSALRKSLSDFYQATSALAVRTVLTSSTAGKLSIWFQWLLLPILFFMWIARFAPITSIVSGYAAFMCVRELFSLLGLRSLEQYVKSQPAQA